MLSVINRKFWRNGIALGMLIIGLWQVRLASAQSTVFINFPVQGWYLVSVPLAITDSSVSAVFPPARGVLGVFTWDNANSRYVTPTTIQIGCGYWVLIAAPTSMDISGTLLSQFTAHYKVGWHLIGSVMDSVNFANPNDTPDGSVILPIFAWDAFNQRYVPRNYLEQSYGHWMFVLQECDLIVRSGSGMIVGTNGDKFAGRAFYQPPPPPFRLEQKQPSSLPSRFALLSNYPNPFSVSGATAIHYVLTETGMASVVVYNNLGQKIRTLLERRQAPGLHEAIWDGRDDHGQPVGSGVYYYRLVINGFTQTKQMLVVR